MFNNATYLARDLPGLLDAADALDVIYDDDPTVASIVLSIWYLISSGRHPGNLASIPELPAIALGEVVWLERMVRNINLAIENAPVAPHAN